MKLRYKKEKKGKETIHTKKSLVVMLEIVICISPIHPNSKHLGHKSGFRCFLLTLEFPVFCLLLCALSSGFKIAGHFSGTVGMMLSVFPITILRN